MNTPDLYDLQFEGLVRVHRILASELTAIADAPTDAKLEELVKQTNGAGHFVLGHHFMEDTILFPGLRNLGSGAGEFLDERDREHHVIHSLTERLIEHAKAPHPKANELSSVARELLHTLGEHVKREEAGLSAENLRKIITLPRFTEIVARIDAERAAAQVKIAGVTK
ncbi:MAG: hemerythrin domain-containing protein [Archangium sp.]